MQGYSIGYTSFNRAFPSQEKKLVRKPIEELIQRFNIKNKGILSIGSGIGSEEIWFNISGSCSLTLVDIDEHDSIQPTLKSLPYDENGLTYWIGDASCSEKIDGEFDVLYFSSFTPDEFHRKQFVEKQASKKIRISDWPCGAPPFSKLVMDLANQKLKEGGLLIVQSYFGGPTLSCRFLKLVRKQLKAEANIDLLEAYRWKEEKSVKLLVGQKISSGKANQTTVKNSSELISCIHGRGSFQNQLYPPIEKIFSI